ncbi:MAG: GspE/PulE family protein [Patescibacteria group bacterium]|nr:GspE/PulE family protein [Patescibacteria group bacterium]
MVPIPSQKLKTFLLEQGLIEEEDFNQALEEARRMNQDLGDVLISKGFVTKDFLLHLASNFFRVELANLRYRGINREVLYKIEEKFAREKNVIAFAQEGDGTIDVAMADPTDLITIEFLEKKLSSKIRPFLASDDDLAFGFSAYGSQLTQDFKRLIEENIKASLERKISASKEEEAATQLPIVEIVNNTLSYASSLNTSDIHLEAMEDSILVRFRIDGILHEVFQIPKEVHPAIVARIKLLASLKVDEHQKPQDGRFRYKVGSTVIDVRVSVIPTLYGEKIVLRLLPATQRPLSLIELGMTEETAKIVEENIKKTYGMILVTGPTGSGKTTTLYSILNMLNRPEVNIVTIEDPIEYNIKYINQVQINPLAGITFASGLRSILRQDPNIIMVGEIRDQETAEIAVNAALTGHLLLSSLHTNDAPTAVPRLIDMGIPPFLVAAVLNMVLAQRLVRKICLDCIESFSPSEDFLHSLRTQIKSLNLPDSNIPRVLYRGKGCKSCGGTGYRGRMGIFELLEVNEDIRKIIVSPDFSLDLLTMAAKKNGMVTMFEDGLRKASLGQTTIEEVLRVIRE